MKKYLPFLIVLGIGLFILYRTGKLNIAGWVKAPPILIDRATLKPDPKDPSKIVLGDPSQGW